MERSGARRVPISIFPAKRAAIRCHSRLPAGAHAFCIAAHTATAISRACAASAIPRVACFAVANLIAADLIAAPNCGWWIDDSAPQLPFVRGLNEAQVHSIVPRLL
jgi:glucokinase